MRKITLLSLLFMALFAVNAQTYNFNTDNDQEGWTAGNATLAVNGGIMTLTPSNHANPNIQCANGIDADTNGYVHLKIKNHSSIADEIRCVIRNAADNGNTFINADISKEDSDFMIYNILLSGADGWSGTVNAITMRFTDRNTVMDGSDNDIDIDYVVFDNSPTLNVESLEKFKFSFYPNPAQDKINLSAIQHVEQVQLYTLLGKEVLNVKLNNHSNQEVDISSLSTGIYNMKVTIGETVGIVKFIRK